VKIQLVQRDWYITTVTNLVKILLVQRDWQIITVINLVKDATNGLFVIAGNRRTSLLSM
jgi:3-dehydroquinate synthase class II